MDNRDVICVQSDSVWSFLEPLLLVYQNYNEWPLSSVPMLWEPHGHWLTNTLLRNFCFSYFNNSQAPGGISIAILILMPISLQLIFNDSSPFRVLHLPMQVKTFLCME